MLSGRQWGLLAEATLNFIARAKEYGFCLDMLKRIEGRLYEWSPFPIHRKERRK